ncbi:MAG: hypothetical protein AAF503_06575, partial [Pseudomonadota bacterium]
SDIPWKASPMPGVDRRMLDRLGDEEGAMQAYRRTLEIHPNLEPAQEAVERLSPEVDGREL